MYHGLIHHDYEGDKNATPKACWQKTQCDGDVSWQSYGVSRETKVGNGPTIQILPTWFNRQRKAMRKMAIGIIKAWLQQLKLPKLGPRSKLQVESLMCLSHCCETMCMDLYNDVKETSHVFYK
jgi:hypothetical protein